MKKKNKKKIIVILIIAVILIIGITIFINIKNKEEQSNSSTTQIVEVLASTQTIENTLTSSGQISSSATNKIYLSTSKYFKTMCVEEDDTVLEGENILQYSNGTYLTAEYDCVISSYVVPETGSICTSSNYIEVKNLKDLTMSLSINESEINSVKVGQSVEIKLSADETKTYTGTISKIDAIGTYATSGTTFKATVSFSNDGNVKIGMSASCTVVLEKAENCIAVPITAIQTSGETKYVIVVNEDKTTKNVTVETGISNDSYVQIKSGLSGNETVQTLQTTSSSSSSKRNSSKTNSSSNSSGFGAMSEGPMPSMSGGQMPNN